MNKKIYIIIALLVLVSGGVYFYYSQKPASSPEDIVDVIVDQTEDNIAANSVIVVPDDLIEITSEDYEKYKSVNCTTESKTQICEYYIQTKNANGEKSYKNLEWNSLCAYVKKYEGEGRFSTGSYEYETLGYEDRPCYQGMYKSE